MSLPQKAVGLLIRGSRISLINGRTPQLTAGMRFLSCSDCRSRCHLISLGETDGRENPGSASGPSLNVASGAPASTSDVIQYAASCHRLGSKDGLDNLVRLIMVDGGARVPVPHRTLYFAMDLALNLKCTELAAKLSSLMPQKVNVLATSLRIRLLSQQERTREALSQIELVLNEDKPALDVSIKIANEALDDLCGAIKRTSDRVEQIAMNWQILLTFIKIRMLGTPPSLKFRDSKLWSRSVLFQLLSSHLHESDRCEDLDICSACVQNITEELF